MKKKMKKLTALLVAMMLVFSGCAEKEEPVIQEEEDIVVEEVVEETVEESVEEEIPLSVHTTTQDKKYFLEEGDIPYFYLQYCDVFVEGTGFEKVKRNIENWPLERNEELRGVHEAFLERAQTEAKDNEEFYGYTLYQKISTARADEYVSNVS